MDSYDVVMEDVITEVVVAEVFPTTDLSPPTEKDWAYHENTIKSLYEKISLKELMERMKRDCSFDATYV